MRTNRNAQFLALAQSNQTQRQVTVIDLSLHGANTLQQVGFAIVVTKHIGTSYATLDIRSLLNTINPVTTAGHLSKEQANSLFPCLSPSVYRDGGLTSGASQTGWGNEHCSAGLGLDTPPYCSPTQPGEK